MCKKRLKSLFALFVCAVLLFNSGALSVSAKSEKSITAGLSAMEKKEGYSLVAEDKNLKLYLDTKSTDFYIEDSATGIKSFAFPESFKEDDTTELAQQIEMQAALVFTFWDPQKKTENRKNSNAVCVKQDSYTVYKDKNGFLIEYNLRMQQITVYLSVKLQNGKLYCTVPSGAIKEEAPDKCMLLNISVLPYMVSGEANTEGKIILPDGCGEVLDFGTLRSSYASYKKHIYGRDLSTTLSIKSNDGYGVNCPYLALLKDGIGMLSLPEKGAAVGYVNANPAGKMNRYANAYYSFDYRASDIAIIGDKQTMKAQSTRVFSDDVYKGDITVSYSFIFDNPTVSAVADLYGKYLFPNGSIQSKDHSAVIDVYGFVNEPKSFFGFPYTGVSVISKGEDIISLAKSEKLKGTTLVLKNITVNQQKNTVDNGFKPISKVLSSSQLKTLIGTDSKIFVDADPLTFKKGTLAVNGFFSAAKTVYGAPVGLYEYRKSTHMANKKVPKSLLLKHKKIESTVNKLVSDVGKKGIDGISSDTLGVISYHDYSSGGTLEDTRCAVESALKNAAKKTKLILKNPCDYALKYCSALTDIPISSSNDDICSASYPFLQMAFGEHIRYTCEAINLDRSPETMFYKVIALGSGLHYSYILSDTEPIISTDLNFLYSADFNEFKEMTENQYAVLNDIEKKIKGSALVDYYEQDGKTVSKFKNGKTLTVDPENKKYTVD